MSESFVISNNARIWTVRKGEGFPVIFCNGGPGCCDYLEPVSDMLEGKAQTIRFEERGCGRLENVAPFNIEISLNDLEIIREHYKIDKWVICGHSWGADLALFYALEHTARTAGLICISGGRIHNDREWHSEYKRKEVEIGERMPDFAYPINREVNDQVSRSWKNYIQKPDLLKRLSKLETPALFVFGDKDIRPNWATQQIANLMPNALFELVSDAEHVIWFSHANELKSLLSGFVEEIKSREV